MLFISATRLRVRSIIYFIPFFRANEATLKQIKLAEGFLAGKELMDKGLVFWTLTMWQDELSMKNFRNHSPHKNAMQKLPHWCNEASYIHWSQREEVFPEWKIVHEKMLAEGKITKVRHASETQLSRNYPEIKWSKSERNFKPLSLK